MSIVTSYNFSETSDRTDVNRGVDMAKELVFRSLIYKIELLLMKGLDHVDLNLIFIRGIYL